MSILKDILDTFKPSPQGPVWRIDDLESNWNEYKKAAICMCDAISAKASNVSAYDTYMSRNDEDSICILGARIRWRYLNIIDGWVVREFIEKIRDFSRRIAPSRSDYPPPPCYRYAYEGGNHDVCIGNNIETLMARGDNVVSAIEFFLCDTRSPFEQGRAFEDGQRSVMEISRWYMGGLDIVKRNMIRIENAARKALAKGV